MFSHGLKNIVVWLKIPALLMVWSADWKCAIEISIHHSNIFIFTAQCHAYSFWKSYSHSSEIASGFKHTQKNKSNLELYSYHLWLHHRHLHLSIWKTGHKHVTLYDTLKCQVCFSFEWKCCKVRIKYFLMWSAGLSYDALKL